MNRRELVTLLGGATVWPLSARAQQAALPVVAILSNAAPNGTEARGVADLRRGLEKLGYVDGRNLAIEHYLADIQRMPSIIEVLISRKVSLLIPIGNAAAQLTKASTTSIPIVFLIGGNPVDLGLVASLARPGGNATGTTNLNNELEAKRFEILTELIPSAAAIGLVVNPPAAAGKLRELEPAARRLGRELRVFKASNEGELERAFASVAGEHIGAVQITTDALFNSRIEKLAELATRYAIPSIYAFRDFAAGGGLASYGPNISEDRRLAAGYAARILKGEKPADLPVIKAARFEFVLNLKMARALGVTVPLPLVARADEVIE